MKASIYSRPNSTTTMKPRESRRVSLDIDKLPPAPLAVHATSDCFVTPPEVAERMADYANLEAGLIVCDGSAGTGNLLKAIIDTQENVELFANELNYDLYQSIKNRFIDQSLTITQGDFLAFELPKVDRFILNPPFKNRSAYKHIEHAKSLLNSDGSIIALVPSNFHIDGMYTIEDLPSGTFSNTAISTKIIEIEI